MKPAILVGGILTGTKEHMIKHHLKNYFLVTLLPVKRPMQQDLLWLPTNKFTMQMNVYTFAKFVENRFSVNGTLKITSKFTMEKTDPHANTVIKYSTEGAICHGT